MRFRAWTITLNYYDETDMQDLYTFITKFKTRHYVFGFEGTCCDKTHAHIHLAFYVENACTFGSFMEYFTKQHHYEAVRDYKSMVEYCKGYEKGKLKCCEENIYMEDGEMPHQGKLSHDRIEEIMNNPYENFHLYNQYRRSYIQLKNTEWDQSKVRVLKAILYESRYMMAKYHISKGQTVCLYPSEYDGENVLIVPLYCMESHIMSWINNIPFKDKNGYEYRVFDPDIVYISYENAKEKVYIIKKYVEVIDEIQETSEIQTLSETLPQDD